MQPPRWDFVYHTEQSGISFGLSYDSEPEHFARYGRRNAI
jgi:hypothetical protein